MATRHQVRQAVVSLLYSNEINPVTAAFEEEFLEEKKIMRQSRLLKRCSQIKKN